MGDRFSVGGLFDSAFAGEQPIIYRFPSALGPSVMKRKDLGFGFVLWLVPEPRVETLPVPADALIQTREASEGTRMQEALEVERWFSGEYPESLEALRDREIEPLAVQEGDRYTYERLSEGYRLFPSNR